jgi:ketosteroid isomerase-like protein
MTSTTIPFDLEAMRTAIEREGSSSIERFFAEDIVWTVIDARTPPSAPAVLHGRDEVLAMVRGAEARGIVTRLGDGLVAGDRAAVALNCTYPAGGKVAENALLTLRDGLIVRWDGVQAWDE